MKRIVAVLLVAAVLAVTSDAKERLLLQVLEDDIFAIGS